MKLENLNALNSPITIPGWTFYTMAIYSTLNESYGDKRLDSVYFCILLMGINSHAKKTNQLGRFPNWAYWLLQSILCLSIYGILIQSIYGEALDKWFFAHGL